MNLGAFEGSIDVVIIIAVDFDYGGSSDVLREQSTTLGTIISTTIIKVGNGPLSSSLRTCKFRSRRRLFKKRRLKGSAGAIFLQRPKTLEVSADGRPNSTLRPPFCVLLQPRYRLSKRN